MFVSQRALSFGHDHQRGTHVCTALRMKRRRFGNGERFARGLERFRVAGQSQLGAGLQREYRHEPNCAALTRIARIGEQQIDFTLRWDRLATCQEPLRAQ